MTSPFKFLDPFERSDCAMFFGREAETEHTYALVLETELVLIYGDAGTGKTSLVQCGLANLFPPTDWEEVPVRRGSNINASLAQAIRVHAKRPIADASPVAALRSLYLDHARRIYLIFDEFEELLVLGDEAEQEAFYATIAAILRSGVSCKVVIILREEYLADLHRFEAVVPTLFDKRLRIAAMSSGAFEGVVVAMAGAAGIVLEHGCETARAIVEQVARPKVGVQLPALQVFLDQLYTSCSAAANDGPVVFTDAAVAASGRSGDILGDFLDGHTASIQADLAHAYPSIGPGSIRTLVEQFVSFDGTRQPTTRAQIDHWQSDPAPWLDRALDELVDARVLRVVGEHYELAHDALAWRIGEGRSAGRLELHAVHKLIRDGLAAWQDARTPLGADDLSRIDRWRRLQANGLAALGLTGQEHRLIRRSVWRRRRFQHRYQLMSLGVLAILTMLLFVPVVLQVTGLSMQSAANSLFDAIDPAHPAKASHRSSRRIDGYRRAIEEEQLDETQVDVERTGNGGVDSPG